MSLGDLLDEELSDFLQNSYGLSIRKNKLDSFMEEEEDEVLEKSDEDKIELDEDDENSEDEAPAYYTKLSEIDPSLLKY